MTEPVLPAEAVAHMKWECMSCGEAWNLDDIPPDEAECIYCGGEIDAADPFWRWAPSRLNDGSVSDIESMPGGGGE